MVTCSAEVGGLYDFGASSSELGGADGKQREGESDRRALPDLSGEQRAAGEVRLTRNGNADMSKQEVSLTGAHGSRWKLVGGESCLLALFKVFTELPLASFFKLLSNLYGNSKISKNKSCSKFKVLNFALITILKLCLHLTMQV